MAVDNNKEPRIDVGSDWAKDTLAQVQAAFNGIKGRQVVHYWCDTLQEAVTTTTTGETGTSISGIAVCPNGIVVRGALIATPNQSVEITQADWGINVIVDGVSNYIRTCGGLKLGTLHFESGTTYVTHPTSIYNISTTDPIAQVLQSLQSQQILDGDYFEPDNSYYLYIIDSQLCDVSQMPQYHKLVYKKNNNRWYVELLDGQTMGNLEYPIYIENGVIKTSSKYAGGTKVTLNNTSKANGDASFYAPIASGTTGQLLQSQGTGKAPTWINNDFATKEDVAALTESGMVLVGEINASTNEYHISSNAIKSDTDAQNTGNLFMQFVGTGHRQSELRRYFDIKVGWQFKVAVAGTIEYESASSVGDNDQSLTLEVGDTIIFTNSLAKNSQGRDELGNILPTDIMALQTNIDKATKNVFGLVKVGSNINVQDGTISVPTATKNALGVVKVGSTLDGNGGTIDAPTMTSERAGIAAVGSNLEIQTGHLGVKKGDGLTSDSNGGLTIEKPVVSATQGAGDTNVKISIGRVESDWVTLPHATGQAYGTSLNDFGYNEKAKLDALNIITGTCSTPDATPQKNIVFEDSDSKMSMLVGTVLCVKFTNTNTANNPRIKMPNSAGTIPIIYKGSALTGNGNGTVFVAGYWTTFILTNDGWVFISNNEDDIFTHVKYGGGYATCSTAAATAAKTASLTGFALAAGGIVSVRFDNNVPANATLNINSKGAKPIYWHNAAIIADTIKGGDTATFMYDGSHYILLSTDHDVTTVNVSVSESNKNVTNAKTEDYDKPLSVASAHYLFSALAQRIQELEDAMTWQ